MLKSSKPAEFMDGDGITHFFDKGHVTFVHREKLPLYRALNSSVTCHCVQRDTKYLRSSPADGKADTNSERRLARPPSQTHAHHCRQSPRAQMLETRDLMVLAATAEKQRMSIGRLAPLIKHNESHRVSSYRIRREEGKSVEQELGAWSPSKLLIRSPKIPRRLVGLLS